MTTGAGENVSSPSSTPARFTSSRISRHPAAMLLLPTSLLIFYCCHATGPQFSYHGERIELMDVVSRFFVQWLSAYSRGILLRFNRFLSNRIFLPFLFVLRERVSSLARLFSFVFSQTASCPLFGSRHLSLRPLNPSSSLGEGLTPSRDSFRFPFLIPTSQVSFLSRFDRESSLPAALNLFPRVLIFETVGLFCFHSVLGSS